MSSGGGNPPKAYNPTGQGAADQQYQQQAQSTGGWAQSIPQGAIPQYQGLVAQQAANPYAAGAVGAANQVAGLGQNVGYGDLSAASNLYGGANTALGTAGQALQSGFDPQHALYNQMVQQTTDSSNANNAMYGLQNSPYGAGVANQNNQNFNINWQNQQLGRQLQALSGYDSALGAAGGAYGQAANLGDQGLSTIYDTGMLPYNTQTGINQNNMNFLNQGTSGEIAALQPGFQQQQSDLSYLGVGQGATSVNQNAWSQQQQANQNLWSGVGNLFGTAAEMAIFA